MGVHASRLFFRLLDEDVDRSLDTVCEELTETPQTAERLSASSQIAALRTLATQLALSDRDVQTHIQRAEIAARMRQEPWPSLGRALEVCSFETRDRYSMQCPTRLSGIRLIVRLPRLPSDACRHGSNF